MEGANLSGTEFSRSLNAKTTPTPPPKPVACVAGTHSSSGYQPCTGTPCAAGRHGPVAQMSAASATCADCAAGRFNADPGAGACAACPAGKWQGAMAASSCTSCAAGRVSAKSTVVACADCATGWFAAVDTCTNEPPVLCPGSDAATCAADATDGATVVLEAKAYTWSSEITFENKRITIVGRGSTTLDRQLGGRFFTINSGGHVTVKHLTITGGKAVRLLALRFRVRFH